MNAFETMHYAAANKAIEAAKAMLVAIEQMRAANDVNEWHWIDANKIFLAAVRAAKIAGETAEAAGKFELADEYMAQNNAFGDARATIEIELYQLKAA